MQKKPTTDYDFTKGMLKTIRNLQESLSSKKILKEQEEYQQQTSDQENTSTPNENTNNDITVVNNVEIKLMSNDQNDMTLMDDQKNSISQLIDSFREQVSQIVEFDPGMTFSPTQIRLDGTLTDNDVSFVLIAGQEGGLYINADMLKLEQETMIVLGKLVRFDSVFKTSMDPLITQRNNN